MSTHAFCSLEDSPRVLAALLEDAGAAIVRADLDGVIVGWSRGATRLYGYAPEEAVGSSLGMLVPDERWDELGVALDEIRAGAAVDERETVRRAKSGRFVGVLLSMVPVRDELGRAVGSLSTARDLTFVAEAASAYRASEARWRAIVDSAVDAVVMIDARGTIECFNQSAERLFGYKADEVLGRNVTLLMPPPHRDAHDGYLASYLAGAPAKIIGIGRDVMARRKNGEDFPARLAVGEASVDGEAHFTGMVHDLSERVQMEQRLREHTTLAQLGEMSAVVAHEVGNALAGVRGAVRVIGDRLPEGGPDASVAREVVDRLDALAKVVRDMLLYAHLPAPKFGRVDLAGLASATANLTRSDAMFHDVRVDVAGAAPPVRGDEGLLRTVFLNLFTNSAQAMHGSGTIRVVIEADHASCRIVVADQGPGVPPEVRDRLFLPFVTTKTRGSGLGLATAKRIVEAHEGTISLRCPTGGGTIVVISLPLLP